MKNPHAVALGQIGGKSTSPAKQEASRENGKAGGRPPAQFGTCPKCGRRISILKAGGFREHKLNGVPCTGKGE